MISADYALTAFSLFITSAFQSTESYHNHPINWKHLNENDPNLLKFTRSHIYPPSSSNYSLHEYDRALYSNVYKGYKKKESFQFIKKVLKLLFDDRHSGFFVEVGGFDGEFLSHSLYLETKLKWRGLIVEPSKAMFLRLQKKNRKSFISDLCVAKGNYSYEDILQNKIVKKVQSNVVQIHFFLDGFLMNSKNEEMEGLPGQVSFTHVNCVPLITILKATGQFHIDVVIMDINGLEFEVMKNFPFEQISVDVWIIRNRNSHFPYPPESFDFKFIRRFASKGYAFYAIGYKAMDYVMIDTRSDIYESALKKRPKSWWELVKYFTILYPPKF